MAMKEEAARLPPALAWVNGLVVPAEEAKIPLEDRSVVFGEAAYEVLLARGKRVYEFERHMVRFERSLQGVGIDPAAILPLVNSALAALGAHAVEGVTALVYLHATGGVAPREHLPARDPKPALYVTWRTVPPGRVAASPGDGVSLASMQDFRWQRATYKTTQLLGSVQAKRTARAAGATEALFVDADGHVLEASSQNVFMVRDGQLFTPPLSLNLLPGVTRALILEHWPVQRAARSVEGAAGASSSPVIEQSFSIQALRQADEVFLSSTTRAVLAVTQLDGAPVGSGQVGPVSREIAAFMNAHLLAALGPERV